MSPKQFNTLKHTLVMAGESVQKVSVRKSFRLNFVTVAIAMRAEFALIYEAAGPVPRLSASEAERVENPQDVMWLSVSLMLL
jgi:hypothetical protein